MFNFIIEPAKTVCVTGHRILGKDIDQKNITVVFKNLIKKGYNTFLIGMAIGFDTLCFKILQKIRDSEDIKIIACVPCPEQADKFNASQKLEYDSMLKSANEVIILSESYTKTCMDKRNKFLVDNSSLIVSYVRREKSGSSKTENYAIKKGITIIKV